MNKRNLTISVLLIAIILFFVGRRLYRPKKVNPSADQADVCANVNKDDYNKRASGIEKNIKEYSSTSKDITGKSSEGGQQIDYSLQGQTPLITQVFYGETGKSEASYYLQNGNVFYFVKKNSTYALPLFEDSSGKVKSLEVKEFYLGSDQSLCSWLDNGKVQQNDQDTKELVSYLIAGLR